MLNLFTLIQIALESADAEKGYIILNDNKYHMVFVPKYRQKSLYGKFRRKVGDIFRDLCRQRDIELLEGHLMLDSRLGFVGHKSPDFSRFRGPVNLISTTYLHAEARNA